MLGSISRNYGEQYMNRCQGLKNVPILESKIPLYVIFPKKRSHQEGQSKMLNLMIYGVGSTSKQPSSREENTNFIAMVDVCDDPFL